MLKSVSAEVKYCYERATEARRHAFEVAAGEARNEFLSSEARWLKLAESYELSERPTSFLNRPTTFPDHPMCRNCNVPMWLVEIQSSSEQRIYIYECKVCSAKETMTETGD